MWRFAYFSCKESRFFCCSGQLRAAITSSGLVPRVEGQGGYRRRRVTEPLMGARLRVDGRELLGFCNNDYLGLSRHPEVIEALVQALTCAPLRTGLAS